jgi:hypothetical protein
MENSPSQSVVLMFFSCHAIQCTIIIFLYLPLITQCAEVLTSWIHVVAQQLNLKFGTQSPFLIIVFLNAETLETCFSGKVC